MLHKQLCRLRTLKGALLLCFCACCDSVFLRGHLRSKGRARVREEGNDMKLSEHKLTVLAARLVAFYEMVDAYDFADIVADEKDLQMQEQQILSDLKNGNAHFYVQAITDIINEQQDDEIIKTAVVLLNELAGF